MVFSLFLVLHRMQLCCFIHRLWNGTVQQKYKVGHKCNLKYSSSCIKKVKRGEINFLNIFSLAQYIQGITQHVINIIIVNEKFYIFFHAKFSKFIVHLTLRSLQWATHVAVLIGHIWLVGAIVDRAAELCPIQN